MIRQLALWLCVLAALLAPWPARAQVAVPPLTGPVVDLTATLTPEQQRSLDAQLRDFSKRKGSQVVVLLVPSTRPEAIEQYAIRVAEAWKIGRKGTDDGVVMVVAKNDREVRIEVGYGLEGALPDLTAKRIIDQYMVPRFKAGDFHGGITEAVTAVMKLIEGEKLPPPRDGQRRPAQRFDSNTMFMLFVAATIAGGILRVIFGRLLGAGIVGGAIGLGGWLLAGSLLVGAFAALIAFLLTLAGGRPGYYGGTTGRGGFGGGGFGGGGGGFSGGGGGFGGGGASGRW